MSGQGIRQVTVLGAGTMGHGIAQAVAQAGLEVYLVDADEAALERGFRQIRRNLDEGVARGKVTEAERAEALQRLRGRTDIETSAHTSDLVIEAVP
ncbi:MAG TPA: 3-hydroxyacyl-CoA dehydrogenase NAD-binding domain-containing protein, partial [Longimicrobiales bacterium]